MAAVTHTGRWARCNSENEQTNDYNHSPGECHKDSSWDTLKYDSTIITQQYQYARDGERETTQVCKQFFGLFVSLSHMEMSECCSYIRISISLCSHCLDELMNILAQNKYTQSHCGCISPPHRRCISLFQRVPYVICRIHRVSYQIPCKTVQSFISHIMKCAFRWF